MLTLGYITKLNDTDDNLFEVRIPIFEKAGSSKNLPDLSGSYFKANLTQTPGQYNAYKVGDCVAIGFLDNKYERPIILGKLFLGDDSENDPRGFANFESLNIKSSVRLPLNTMFGSVEMSEVIHKILNMSNEGSEYPITPIVNFSRNLLTNINNISVVGYKLTEIVDGDGDSTGNYIIQTSNSQKLTEQLAKKYLLTIMGSMYLPMYDEDTSTHTDVYSYVICVNDGVVYRYEYNEEYGLVAYYTFTLSGGGIGNYLPLSGGNLYGPLGLKARQDATNKAIIKYEEEENQHTNLKITNSSGDIHIKSKYDPEDDEHTSEYGTYIDGVLMKVLSEDEIENILNGQN